MKEVIDFKNCPICNYGKLTNNSGSTSSIYRQCTNCKKYTYYEDFRLVHQHFRLAESFDVPFPNRISKFVRVRRIDNNITCMLISNIGDSTDEKTIEVESYEDIISKIEIMETFS